ncbi:MAG TPA: alpha/beta fold hydrolase [Acidimicrobiales bacterium]|nr:alpha/beta fold hydrolase [Acidimicrobiales bacterium]
MTLEILPGCEPFSSRGDPLGVLLLHGFTGSPASLRSLASALAATGLSVELPRLPGHGTSVADMKTTGWSDWTSAAISAYDELAARSERVAVVGLSMGGGLCAYVAQSRPEVAGCVFINPMVKAVSDELREGLDQLLEAGLDEFEGIGSDIKREGPVEASYDVTPLTCAKSLFEGITEVYANLGAITAPSLLLQSREDHVVTPDNSEDLVALVSGPIERIWLEDSYHVATMDNDQEFVEASTVAFVRKVLGA